MQPDGILEVPHQVIRERPEAVADALDSNRSDLLSLSFRVSRQARRVGWQANLERVDPRHVRCDGNDRHDTSAEALGGRVCSVVADDHCRSHVACLGPAHGLEIERVDVTAPDHDRMPSPAVDSQASASPSASHAFHADS